MSTPSAIVSHAATVDWNLVAAAAATFFGTLTVTIWGWFQGKKKLAQRLEGHQPGQDLTVTGAVLLDNQTLREATMVNRELRDRLLVHSEALHSNCKATIDNTQAMDEIIQELRGLRKAVDKLPTRP